MILISGGGVVVWVVDWIGHCLNKFGDSVAEARGDECGRTFLRFGCGHVVCSLATEERDDGVWSVLDRVVKCGCAQDLDIGAPVPKQPQYIS